jgi:hypothetical protein
MDVGVISSAKSIVKGNAYLSEVLPRLRFFKAGITKLIHIFVGRILTYQYGHILPSHSILPIQALIDSKKGHVFSEEHLKGEKLALFVWDCQTLPTNLLVSDIGFISLCSQ